MGYSSYMGSIPASTYGVLMVACRLGLRPLVYATLRLPPMRDISIKQLKKAQDTAKKFGHSDLSKILEHLVMSQSMASQFWEGEEFYMRELECLENEGKLPEGVCHVISCSVRCCVSCDYVQSGSVCHVTMFSQVVCVCLVTYGHIYYLL